MHGNTIVVSNRKIFRNFFNFWFIGEEPVFKKYASFLASTFSGEVDFSGTLFKKTAYFSLHSKNVSFILNSLRFDKESHIEIRNLNTNNLALIDLTNYFKNFIFFNLKLLGDNESRLEIKNSILNKMRFINCDFSEAENIHIEDSSLTDCEFVNVRWGEITEKRICKELFEKAPEKAQDIYRQLKLAHDNQKDFIHGNDFYALEMRAYERYLSNGNKEKDGKKKKKNIKLQDKIVFKIAKIASNYAQDWVKPLLWITTFALYLSIFTLFFEGYSETKFHSFNYLEFAEYFPSILVFFSSFFVLVFFRSEISKFFCYKILTSIVLTFLLFSCLYIFGVVIDNSDQSLIQIFSNGFDLFFTTLAKLFTPWKTLINSSEIKVPFYKTVFALGSISVSYLVYQLIVALRRKIRR